MHPRNTGASRADATAPTRLPSVVASFPSPLPRCHACPLFLTLGGASREWTRAHTRACMHVHARGAHARAERRAKESAPRRPELSRSHGSSSGSGGDIPTYLPIRPVALEPACRKRLSVSFFYPSLSLGYLLLFLLLLDPLLSPPLQQRHALTRPRETAGMRTTRADGMHQRDDDKPKSKRTKLESYVSDACVSLIARAFIHFRAVALVGLLMERNDARLASRVRRDYIRLHPRCWNSLHRSRVLEETFRCLGLESSRFSSRVNRENTVIERPIDLITISNGRASCWTCNRWI